MLNLIDDKFIWHNTRWINENLEEDQKKVEKGRFKFLRNGQKFRIFFFLQFLLIHSILFIFNHYEILNWKNIKTWMY